MTAIQPDLKRKKRFERLTDAQLLTIISGGIFLLMYGAALLLIAEFRKPQVLFDITNYYSYLIVNGQKSSWETQMTISRGEGRSVTLYVPDFYVSRPRCLNATLSISSKYYQFASDYVYLTSINVLTKGR